MGWPELRVGEVMTGRPGVRVNQPGYLLGRPKEATLVSDAEEPRALHHSRSEGCRRAHWTFPRHPA
jgi:hypothetical protein